MPAGLSLRQMLTVEPVLFLYAYGLFMSVPVSQQYVYYRISEAKGFPYHFQQENSVCGSQSPNKSMEKLEKQASGCFQLEIKFISLIFINQYLFCH